jgi:putative flippase GtrA
VVLPGRPLGPAALGTGSETMGPAMGKLRKERAPMCPGVATALRPHARRFGRYGVATIVATGVSTLCFVAMYGAELAGPQVAGVAAILAGAAPKFVLLRWWVWGRRGMPALLREVAPYALIAAGTGLGSGWLTDLAEAVIVDHIDPSRLRVGLVGAAFVTTMGVMFALRYVLFDRLVFSDRGPAVRRRW